MTQSSGKFLCNCSFKLMWQEESEIPQNGSDWPSPTENDILSEIEEITDILQEKAATLLSKASNHTIQQQASKLLQAIEKVIEAIEEIQDDDDSSGGSDRLQTQLPDNDME